MISNNPSFDPGYINRSYDWKALGDGTIVDIGGGQGGIAFSLAKEFPSLCFTVQDLAPCIDGADALVPVDLARHVKFMAHDFFTPQTIKADAYILRWILHNWSDKYSVKILRALIPGLKPGTRILLQEACLSEPGAVPHWIEKDLR